jgi:methylmalonyl-CoA epimerase
MKAVLDHVGIAVKDLRAALDFYRDALGLNVEAPEEVRSQRVRAHFIRAGESNLELLEATSADSAIAAFVDKRGPGLHHITLRVDDVGAALSRLKARGVRLIDERPRPGADGSLVAFIHPSLADAGLAPEDIDIVLATHLHFDHAGGFTVRDEAGRLRPVFPRAQYIVRRGEWEDATHPHERNRASYFPANYVPLAEAGVLQLVDDDQTIMPGVRVRRTGGHTKHHQIVAIESGGKTAAFVADMMPTSAHLSEPWIMGYDLYPIETLSEKKAFVKEAIAKETLVFFEHDPVLAAGVIREENGRRRVVPAIS